MSVINLPYALVVLVPVSRLIQNLSRFFLFNFQNRIPHQIMFYQLWFDNSNLFLLNVRLQFFLKFSRKKKFKKYEKDF